MKSCVQKGLEVLEFWEGKAFTWLSDLYTPELIEQYIGEYRQIPSDFQNKTEQNNMPRGIFNAIEGISSIRNLIEQLKLDLPDSIHLEDAALFANNAFHAGLSIGLSLPGLAAEALHEEVKEHEKKEKVRPKKARSVKKERITAIRNRAIELFNELRQRNPMITKNAAAVTIQRKLSKEKKKRATAVVRRYLIKL